MKVLLIRFSSIGDLVLISPVIRCLRKTFPQAQIHLLTGVSFADIFRANPYLDRIFWQQEPLPRLIQKLRAERYDFIADLQNNRTSWLIRRLLGRRQAAVHKLNLEKWLLVNFKINWLPVAHLVDRYLNVVRPLGVRNDGKGLDYFIPPDQEIPVDRLPLTHLHGYAALAVGAAHATKKMPLAKLQQLVQRLPLPIVLLGGKEDELTGNLLQELAPLKVHHACGRLTLHQSASVIRQARVVITPDTGLMHIAAAFRKRIISVWGNTVPALGMFPYFGDEPPPAGSRIVERAGLSCRPCSKLGFSRCPKGHFRCMNDLDVDEIVRLAMA
ncbi:MAG: glycosyltransferase family 9 protein [Chitinophagales bacterium]|nr:glycosyltransferase family 9 protein [Chitinophagales bacterium]